jgi:hypothetical protein
MKQRNYEKWFCRFEKYEMVQGRIDDVYIVLGSFLFYEDPVGGNSYGFVNLTIAILFNKVAKFPNRNFL